MSESEFDQLAEVNDPAYTQASEEAERPTMWDQQVNTYAVPKIKAPARSWEGFVWFVIGMLLVGLALAASPYLAVYFGWLHQ